MNIGFDHSPSHSCRAVVLFVAIAVMFAAVAQAQSGRRSAKSADKTEKLPPRKVSLLVSVEDRDQFSNIPYYLADSALDNCIDRLRDAAEISVSSSARGMSRAEAIHRAKAESRRPNSSGYLSDERRRHVGAKLFAQQSDLFGICVKASCS